MGITLTVIRYCTPFFNRYFPQKYYYNNLLSVRYLKLNIIEIVLPTSMKFYNINVIY